ncbi:response regulator transcription factor [Demequina sp. NBRC 110057]|uniref:response regulator transcription factor n=1 Tax=Demequina sp. NBRC 110057 TaxID=1570346 RepID=UPI0009FEB087|nr:response regulator transcription factor [Demequina sp. NBRC 110057]
MSQILIIEDEDRIASFITKGLKAAGFTSTHEATGSAGYERAMTGDFELIVLDLGLPDMDGMDVLERLRGSGNDLPVIVLTARTTLEASVGSLEGGADDYLAKPFRFEELLARIRLRLRSPVTPAVGPVALTCADVSLDPLTRRVTVAGAEVDLSAREFALAEALMSHAGRALSREQLLSRVWGYDFDPGSNVVDVYVRYLRGKLGAGRIETVRGVGYRMVA